MFNKLKQFQDVRSRAKQMQKQLEDVQLEGSAGWGKVKVTLNGNQRVVKFEFADEVMNDKAKLEGYAKDAVNDAMEKLQKEMAGKMKDLGGLDLAQDIQGMMGKQ
ncbi:YbaB/EbfC family nucleoid-associated protein [Candidatus Uhrbacteria bacterium]|nr:YbaB/EbfC family nucleoid-associated protein [Candidatus Uhrbacteria bacterium]